MFLKTAESKSKAWMSYNGYKLANLQEDLTNIQYIWELESSSLLHNEMHPDPEEL